MIDLHSHLLPGVDDGPRTWAEALALCAQLVEEGIVVAVATPHLFLSRWRKPEPERMREALARLNRELDGRLRVLPGAEVRIASELRGILERGADGLASEGWTFRLNDTSYMLVEFPPEIIPPGVEHLLFEAMTCGIRPILAHPERHVLLRAHPERLRSFVERGCLVQVDAASIVGDHGREARRAAMQWIAHGLVQCVASDAHRPDVRPPRLRRAWAEVCRAHGEAVARALFCENPRAIICGVEIVRL